MNVECAKKWKVLSNSEKQKFDRKATLDKVRYLREVSEYNKLNKSHQIVPKINAPHGYDQDGTQVVTLENSSSTTSLSTGYRLSSSSSSIERPLSKYSFYARQVFTNKESS